MVTKKTAPVARRPLKPAEPEEGAGQSNYFTDTEAKSGLKFVSSGCAIMDEALGGGYVLGRTVNIVGDRSSGKTLKAMELLANFFRKHPDGWARYAESEAAFDKGYAQAMGIPVDRIIFNSDVKLPAKKKKDDAKEKGGIYMVETVEDLYDDLEYHLDQHKGKPGIYVIDSLDALSDEAEVGREFNEGTYGGTKPKQIGKLFRMLIQRMEDQEVMFVVISQIRDKLNVTFGETKTRSGGKALDFYATHIVWLAEIEKIKKTKDGVTRIVGVRVKARVKKNKVGLPFRECEYPILFGYGIDDLTANTEWLLEVGCEKQLAELGLSKAGYKVRIGNLRDKGGAEARELRAGLVKLVRKEWGRIETGFLPNSRKY